MEELPRYALLEIERRWLVDLAAVGDLTDVPYRVIDDLYIAGTRLRLRKVTDRNGVGVFKLGKKYGKRTPLAEPITTLYLSDAEHQKLAGLPGASLTKKRYTIAGGSLDVFPPPHDGLAIFELELPSEEAAGAYVPPPFVRREVTGDPSFTGFALAARAAPPSQPI